MIKLELLKHPDWYTWDENQKLVLVPDAPAEAQKAYLEYLDLLKYEEEHQINF